MSAGGGLLSGPATPSHPRARRCAPPDPVGFAASRVDADEGEVLSVAIAREAHGRGCAGPLLRRHLESLAPALALYRRLGFAEVGRRPGYYLRPDGSRATALTMTKLL